MQNNLSENLNILMSRARISSDELARQIGVPATTIKRIRNNEHANPTIYTLIPIANYFSISLNELISASISMNNILTFSKINRVPIFSWQEGIHYKEIEYNKRPKNILTERPVSEKSFALMIEDDSLDFFQKGGFLIVDPLEQPLHGDYVIIANLEKNLFSIRKFIVDVDQIYLKPLIAGVPISIVTLEHKIMGVILQYKIELKK